jgi:muconolactone delta-isomerase
MLFQVITRANPIGISGEEYLKRLPDGMAYMRGLLDQGVIKHSWAHVGKPGGTSIFDIDDLEVLLQLLYDNPIAAYLTFEVTPLVPLTKLSRAPGLPVAGH